MDFLASEFYHVFNRGNNRERIFFTDDNYLYFLRKYEQYLEPFVHTYAYCLLPNHFHFLIRVKEDYTEEGRELNDAFRRFFMSYSKSINKQEGRTGSLFQKNFKGKLVTREDYITRLIAYIHWNPEKHKIVHDYSKYPHSSFQRIVSGQGHIKLEREKVLEWFGGLQPFIDFHNLEMEEKRIQRFLFE